MTKLTLALLVALLILPGCGRRGGDNPGGYSDSYWADRRAKSDFAHRPGKGRRDNMWTLALLGAVPSRHKSHKRRSLFSHS